MDLRGGWPTPSIAPTLGPRRMSPGGDDDGRVCSADLALPLFDPAMAGAQPGPWNLHSLLLRRTPILESGLLEHQCRWAAIFEQLCFVDLLKIGGIARCETTSFYWRDHPDNLSSTEREEAALVRQQRGWTGYTLDQVWADADAIEVQRLAERLRHGTL